MMLRNTSSGAFEVYNISNNQLTSASNIGTVGLDWQIAGFGDFNGDGTSDMMLRNTSTGSFEGYDISNSHLSSASNLGAVGVDWQFAGGAAMTGNSILPLVQAMAAMDPAPSFAGSIVQGTQDFLAPTGPLAAAVPTHS